MAEIKTFTDEDEFWTVVETVSSWPDRLAMSGGSAAKFLDQVFVPDTTHIFLADERYVNSAHPDSNAKLIRTKFKEKNFVDRLAFYKQGLTSAECVSRYEKILETDNENLFDVVVLGVGPDGHTASLFPNSEALKAEGLTVATQAPKGFAVKDRLSLTFTALKSAKTVLVLLQGSSKKEIFKIITNPETDKHEFPARELLDWDNAHIYWLNA